MSGWSRDECINYRIFVRQMDNYIAAYETKSYLIPFSSDWGFYMDWSRLRRTPTSPAWMITGITWAGCINCRR